MTDRCQKSDARCQAGVSHILSSALRVLISVYRYTLAYFLGGQCRFTPSCSAYAIEAIETYGPLKGLRLAVGRICRCHPWGGHGHDPVPMSEDRCRMSDGK